MLRATTMSGALRAIWGVGIGLLAACGGSSSDGELFDGDGGAAGSSAAGDGGAAGAGQGGSRSGGSSAGAQGGSGGEGARASCQTEGCAAEPCDSDNDCTPLGLLCDRARGICADPNMGGAGGGAGSGAAGSGGAGASAGQGGQGGQGGFGAAGATAGSGGQGQGGSSSGGQGGAGQGGAGQGGAGQGGAGQGGAGQGGSGGAGAGGTGGVSGSAGAGGSGIMCTNPPSPIIWDAASSELTHGCGYDCGGDDWCVCDPNCTVLETPLVLLEAGIYLAEFDVIPTTSQRFDFEVIDAGGNTVAAELNKTVFSGDGIQTLVFDLPACTEVKLRLREREYMCSRIYDVRIIAPQN